MASPYTVPNALSAECGHLAELFAELGHNGGSCGRDELMCFLALAQGNAAENLQRRRSRNRETSMLTFDPAASLLKFRDIEGFNSQCFQSDAYANDVGDGIQRSYFMKMYGFGRSAMDFSLRHGDAVEDGEGMLFDERGKLTALEQGLYVGVAARGL